jgi:hypothetical protein
MPTLPANAVTWMIAFVEPPIADLAADRDRDAL